MNHRGTGMKFVMLAENTTRPQTHGCLRWMRLDPCTALSYFDRESIHLSSPPVSRHVFQPPGRGDMRHYVCPSPLLSALIAWVPETEKGWLPKGPVTMPSELA